MGAGRVSIELGQRENPQECRKITSFPVPIALPCDSCLLGDSKKCLVSLDRNKVGLACHLSVLPPPRPPRDLSWDWTQTWPPNCPRNWHVCVGHQFPSCGIEPALLLSHCHRQGLKRDEVFLFRWVGLALELKVGIAFVEG